MTNNPFERLYNGIVKENPVFVMMLGMCPTLAVTTGAVNAIGMGLSTTAVLIFSNFLISLLRKIIPNGVRVPAFIVIVASLVTVVQFLLQAYVPSVNESLGIYIPLIVVNCIILGRAEAYASKSDVISSIFDGIGMGVGFTIALFFLGLFRELVGAGTMMNVQVMPKGYEGATMFIMAPGAFLVLAFLTLIQNKAMMSAAKRGEEKKKKASCASCKLCGPKAEEKPAPKAEPVKAEEKPAPKTEPVKAEEKPAPKTEEVKTEEKPADKKEEEEEKQ